MYSKSFFLIRNAGHCQTVMSCNTIGLFTLGVPNWDFLNKTWPLVLTYRMGKVTTHDNVKTYF